ncbi:MAG: hypothetical protein ACYCPR_08850 [Thermoplasmataceae archaeon]|jgi:hypothetical protein
MSLHIKRKRTLIYSSIVILILIFGVIFPVYNVYGFIFNGNPPITVQDGYYNTTYSGDYRNIGSLNPVLFSTNASRSTVVENNHPDSTLNLNLTNGGIYFTGAPMSHVDIIFNLSVAGTFANNLHPKSLTISFGAVGPNQTTVILETLAPPYSTYIPVSSNLSPYTLGKLVLVGPGYTSVTTKLLNQYTNDPFYNFYVSVQMWVTVKWYSDTNHTFNLSAQVNGLSKPVNSTLSLNIFEKS